MAGPPPCSAVSGDRPPQILPPPHRCSSPWGLFYSRPSACNAFPSSVRLANPTYLPRLSSPNSLPSPMGPLLDSRGFINATPQIHSLPLLFGFFLACGLTSNPSAYLLTALCLLSASREAPTSYSLCPSTQTRAWNTDAQETLLSD